MKDVEAKGVIMVLNVNRESERSENYQSYEHLKQVLLFSPLSHHSVLEASEDTFLKSRLFIFYSLCIKATTPERFFSGRWKKCDDTVTKVRILLNSSFKTDTNLQTVESNWPMFLFLVHHEGRFLVTFQKSNRSKCVLFWGKKKCSFLIRWSVVVWY